MKILYIGLHQVLEHEELLLLTELGHDVFSLEGAFADPKGHITLARPGISGMIYHEDWYKRSKEFPRTDIPMDFVDLFDLIIVTGGSHDVGVISNNWKRLSKKKVIWRSIGQSGPSTESSLAPFKQQGLKLIRYSPKERLIPNYMGEDVLIRFYKDPEEYKDWNGNVRKVITIAQSLKGRAVHCHYEEVMSVVENLPAKVYGNGNEDLGILNGGAPDYLHLKEILRDNRVFLYTGTWPAPYTLGLMEAMMCFPPDTVVSSDTEIEDVLEKDYEGDLITIDTEDKKITCTPNHPFLTNKGFKKAEDLSIMDCIYTRQDTYDQSRHVDKKRIRDFTKEFSEINKERFGKDVATKNPSRNLQKTAGVGNDGDKLKHFSTNEIFFNTLRDMLLGGNNRWGRDIELQGQFQNKKDRSNYHSINNNPNTNRLVERKIQGSKESAIPNQGQAFRETKNSLYVLLKGLAATPSFRGINTLSLNQKRALWNTDFFYQESSEAEIYGEILGIRNKLLAKDKTIKQTRITKISKKYYKGKVYNLSTADGVYCAEGFFVHNTGIPVVAINQHLAQNPQGIAQSDRFEFYEVHDFIQHGENGYLGNSVQELRKYVELLLANHSLAKKIGDAGRQTAIDLFGKSKIREEWKNFLNNL